MADKKTAPDKEPESTEEEVSSEVAVAIDPADAEPRAIAYIMGDDGPVLFER